MFFLHYLIFFTLFIQYFKLFFVIIRDDKGIISQSGSGKLYLKSPFDLYYVLAAIDGTFCFITINTTTTNAITTTTNATMDSIITNFNANFIDPSEFTSKFYVTFVKPTVNELSGPYLIYQSAIPNLTITAYCDSAITNIGIACVLTLQRPNYKNTYLKVSFHISGFVIIYLFIILKSQNLN
jgi:hypothetical protein